MKRKYDYLLIGAGLFNAVLADRLKKQNFKVLVIEKRNHIGGNCYTYQNEGITVHKYGAHIFHTKKESIWRYVNQFACFNKFINSPIAIYGNEIYNLPFNMNTFTKMWNDVKTPAQAKERINEQSQGINNPSNLEEKAISLVGTDIYEKLIKGYTEKQWGISCNELSSDIIERIPVRYTFDNNYFNDPFQGIPADGYTDMIKRMFNDTEIILNCDFIKEKKNLTSITEKIVYTGDLSELFDYCFGDLEYRSLNFVTKVYNCDNFQGNAVVNYTSSEIPYTRTIEHKYFNFGSQMKTVVSYEFPVKWKQGLEPYYPISNKKNENIYMQYKKLADKKNIIVGGRLGLYKYLDMDKVIEKALSISL